MDSTSSLPQSQRRVRPPAKPVPRIGAPLNTHIRAKVVWALCAVAVSGIAVVAWKAQEPTREPVMLSSQSQAKPQDVGATSMAHFPGLATLSSLPTVAGWVATPAAAVAAPAAFVAAPFVQAAEAETSRARADSAAATAIATSVPISTWPVATRGPTEVMPRSDMRYQANGLPVR